MTSRLRIGVKKFLDGEDIDQGVVADVIPAERTGKTSRRPIFVPVGDAGETVTVDIDPGRYLVQATLPSGSVLMKQVRVGADEDLTLLLEADPSPHEHLSWQHLNTHRRVFDEYAKRSSDAAEAATETRLLERLPHPWNWATLGPVFSDSVATIPDVAAALGAVDRGPLDPPRVSEESDSFFVESVPEAGEFHSHVPRPLYYAAVARGEALDVVALPIPWPMAWSQRTTGLAQFDLAVPRHPNDPLATAIRDPRYGTMIAYTANGAVPTAAKMFEADALAMLASKAANPYAAVAGAYLLLETDREPHVPKSWHEWVDNLANWFEWLPDAAVLAGWLRLKRGPESAEAMADAVDWYRTAVQRGLPVYAPVLRLLNDGLTMLTSDPDAGAFDLAEPAAAIRNVARRANPRQPFTVVRFRGRR